MKPLRFSLLRVLAGVALVTLILRTLPYWANVGPFSVQVLREFYESWDLFHNTYLEGWLIAFVLSLVGVVVVARDQIFIGAAVSQASTVGIALALVAAGLAPHPGEHPVTLTHPDYWLHSDTFQATMAVSFSIIAALVTARGGRVRRESYEAFTGWVFLVSASLSVLLLAHSPHGLEEIHRIHSSSIIGATELDVWAFAVFAVVTAVAIMLVHARLLLFAMDPSMAAAVGMRTNLWAAAISVWLGLAIGLSIRASGMLYTFGSLVLPALVAKNICREVRPMFWVSPLVALGTASVGFILANHFDFPPAQMTVALMGLSLVGVWLWRAWRSQHSAVL
jgi:ABC-type Mn2+/Zn2+ transport system permease subunit